MLQVLYAARTAKLRIFLCNASSVPTGRCRRHLATEDGARKEPAPESSDRLRRVGSPREPLVKEAFGLMPMLPFFAFPSPPEARLHNSSPRSHAVCQRRFEFHLKLAG